MREYDMFDNDDMDKIHEAVEKTFEPCMKRLGVIEDLFLFRSLIASFIENWSAKYEYDPTYIAVSIANMMAEVHLGDGFNFEDDEEDEDE